MNAVKSLARCRQIARRSFSSTPSFRAQDMAKFKEKQRLMQIEDGVPVHLKKGASDRVIFGGVVLASGILFCMSVSTLHKLIFPPPNN
uniref:Cytochrome c oxidase subunit 7A2 n=1 Tax=Dolomedes sulfureus TaxID=492288 RepID=A0A0P0DMG7_9ARAC|nr:cytochrome c oxidase subunit 7A2 [Dolomedes sulfureus]